MSMNDNKGNWEFNFFQKKHDPNQEANLKLAMKFDNGFNPKDIHKYLNSYDTKEELILLKHNNDIK